MSLEIPIDAYLISLDETHNWIIADDDKPFIKAIHTVYLLDRNSHTHCCELTPSFWLIFVYNDIEFDGEVSEEIRERLYSNYADEGGESCYVHVRNIEPVLEKATPGKVYHYGSPEVSEDDVERDDQMESLREYFNCNHCL